MPSMRVSHIVGALDGSGRGFPFPSIVPIDRVAPFIATAHLSRLAISVWPLIFSYRAYRLISIANSALLSQMGRLNYFPQT